MQHSGKAVPELQTAWLREIAHPPFRSVYRRHETVVTVVRVIVMGEHVR
jgi:hypothetical protein